MDSTLLDNIVIAIILIGLIILVFFLVNLFKRKNQGQLVSFAQTSGWQVEKVEEPLISGLRFHGNLLDGKWTMEIVKDNNPRPLGMETESAYSHKTRWWTHSVRLPKGTVVFIPRPSPMVSIDDLQKRSSSRKIVLHLMLGEDVPWASNLDRFSISPRQGEISELYLGLATDPNPITPILKPEIMNALLALPPRMKPSIILQKQKVEIRLPAKELSNPSDLQKFVEFGSLLVKTWEKSPTLTSSDYSV
jgi:hypothetical protein